MARSIDNPVYLWILAAYAPFAKLRSSHSQTIVQEATDALRLPVKLKKLLEASLANFDGIEALVEDSECQDSVLSRSKVGIAIRLWGATWLSQVLFVLLAQASGYTSTFTTARLTDAETRTLMARFSRVVGYIRDEKLQSAYMDTPVLNGNEIKVILGLKSDGRYIKYVIEAVTVWQFDHPQASKDDAKAWLLSQKEGFDIPTN